jgi:hypothetical protein
LHLDYKGSKQENIERKLSLNAITKLPTKFVEEFHDGNDLQLPALNVKASPSSFLNSSEQIKL